MCQSAKLVGEAKRESAMQQRVHSRLASRTLLKFRTCAEGWIAREWTCRKPRRKTHDGSLTKHSLTGTSLMGLDAIRKRPAVKPKFHLYSLPATAERWVRPRERSTPRA